MMALDRLLDGLDVEVEPLAVAEAHGSRVAPAPSLRYTRSGSGVLQLAGGASLRFSRRSVTVVPAPRRARKDGNAAGLHVASQVGYSSRSSFTRVFVASHGAAPRAFRAAADRISA